MTESEIKRKIEERRSFCRADITAETYESDQDKKLPQPPLAKAPVTGNAVKLPHDFSALDRGESYFSLVNARQSRRVYSGESITLAELSWLLWACQGVKSVRGKKYATLRTVPSGGARHPFEAYILAANVEGLEKGIYHYLPMSHSLELLGTVGDPGETICASLDYQKWAAKAAAVFYWSFVPYRAEWRYGPFAHKIALVDMGHVGQALYLAAEALGLGTCGIGAYAQAECDALLGLDGKDEFTVYAEPVGRYMAADAKEELAFYAFVDEEGL